MREERFHVSILIQPFSHQAFAEYFGFVIDFPCHYLTDVLGIGQIFQILKSAHQTGDRPFRWIGNMMLVSYAFYLYPSFCIFPRLIRKTLSRSYSVGVSFASCPSIWTRRRVESTSSAPILIRGSPPSCLFEQRDAEPHVHAPTLLSCQRVWAHNHPPPDQAPPLSHVPFPSPRGQ